MAYIVDPWPVVSWAREDVIAAGVDLAGLLVDPAPDEFAQRNALAGEPQLARDGGIDAERLVDDFQSHRHAAIPPLPKDREDSTGATLSRANWEARGLSRRWRLGR
jgi:hypothetical protein